MGGFNTVAEDGLNDFAVLDGDTQIHTEDDFTRDFQVDDSFIGLGGHIVGERNKCSEAFVLNLRKVESTINDMEKGVAAFSEPITTIFDPAKDLIDRDVSTKPWTPAEIRKIADIFQELLIKIEAYDRKFTWASKLAIARALRKLQKVRSEEEIFYVSSKIPSPTFSNGRVKNPDISLGTICNYAQYALRITYYAYRVRSQFKAIQNDLRNTKLAFIAKCFNNGLEVKNMKFHSPVEFISINAFCTDYAEPHGVVYVRLPDEPEEAEGLGNV